MWKGQKTTQSIPDCPRMQRSNTAMNLVLYVVIALVAAGAGYAYYEHRQNTLVEVDVGSHRLSIQKN